jgi:hypothetical protein
MWFTASLNHICVAYFQVTKFGSLQRELQRTLLHSGLQLRLLSLLAKMWSFIFNPS